MMDEDDREEFEKDRIAEDGELSAEDEALIEVCQYRDESVAAQPCTCRMPYQPAAMDPTARSMRLEDHEPECAWRRQEERRAHARFSDSMRRLNAEVAELESERHISNHRELLPHSTIEKLVASGAFEDDVAEATAAKARFGGRIREFVNGWRPIPPPDHPQAFVLKELADAIDKDADDLRRSERRGKLARARDEWARNSELIAMAKQAASEDLRIAVEAEIERLAPAAAGQDELFSSIKTGLISRIADIFGTFDGIPRTPPDPDAKCFEIPGENGAKGLCVAINPDGSLHLWPVDPRVGDGFALWPESAATLGLILDAYLPGRVVALAKDGAE